MPTRPIDAGTANDRIRPRASQGMRIHHIGIIGAPQNGQSRYGRLISLPLGVKSNPQLGQAPHAFFLSCVAKCTIMAIESVCSHPVLRRVPLHRCEEPLLGTCRYRPSLPSGKDSWLRAASRGQSHHKLT
jgi:hypothetical protein